MVQRTLAAYAAFMATKYPVVTITGPRQSGKTTLAQTVFAHKPYANLENPVVRQFAMDDPVGFLKQYPDGAVLDEIQRVPELLSFLQVIVDEKKENGLFVLTGSQQFELMDSISQSLAGRTALLKLLPFSLAEVESFGEKSIDELLFTGFYPRIHDQNIPPAQALGDYYETYVERDLRQLVNIRNLNLFQRFVQLCAGRVGQLLNLSSLANDTGISHSTAREWLSVLEASYIVFLLRPFHANLGKRLVKSPKIYFYDIGLACWLSGIDAAKQLANHPLRGNFFENMVVLDVLKYRYNLGKRNNLFFYRDSSGNEVDLLYTLGRHLLPIEIKSGQTISSSYFRGLDTFSRSFPDLPHGRLLVYAGDMIQQRTGVTITDMHQLTRFLAEKEG